MTSADESLRQAVLHRLTALEQIADDDTDLAARLPLARSELSRLADGWRLLLTVHSAGEDGRCRACPGWVRHRRRWPCPVWLMAHQHLLGDTLPVRRAVDPAPPAARPRSPRWACAVGQR